MTARATVRRPVVPADPEARRQLQEALTAGAMMFAEDNRREVLIEAARWAWPELFGRPPTLH
ncbi:MAG: hypothetical protein KDH09_15325 [Chrysiogenetes bacterium]|nr:hypothetical protein [Chrysiogenetes bacterium]